MVNANFIFCREKIEYMVAKVITFAHHKGGTGKTTSCINVAGFLARADKKVLVVDLDPQANATSGLGIEKNTLDKSMYNIMNEELSIIEPILINTIIDNIHLAPAHPDLMEAEIKNEKIVRKVLHNVVNSYDYILIDTPPSNKKLIMNGISASERVVLTLDPGVFALEGIDTFSEFMKTADNIELNFKPDMIILTKAKRPPFPLIKRGPVNEILEELESTFLENIYIVPYSIDIYESHKQGVPLSHSFPNSRASVAYRKIADNLMKL